MIFTGSLHMLDEVMYFVPSLKVDVFLGHCRPNDKAIRNEGFKVTHNPNNIQFEECLVVTANVIPELNQTTILEIDKDFYE